jgi:UDP-glucose 4-epimerase
MHINHMVDQCTYGVEYYVKNVNGGIHFLGQLYQLKMWNVTFCSGVCTVYCDTSTIHFFVISSVS